MSTTSTLPNGSAALPTVPELQAEAIAALMTPALRPQSADNGNLGSLWTLLNERVARAAAPAPLTQTPQVQASASVAEPTPATAIVPEAYGTAISETYVVNEAALAAVPDIAPQAVAVPTAAPVTAEIAVTPQTLVSVETAEVTAVTPEPIVPAINEVLTPTIVPATPEAPTVTPLKELLTATARRKTVPPVRLENALRGNTFVLSAHSQGELLPNITLELSAPLGKTVQTASRTGENSAEGNLLATLESIETGGEGVTSLRAVVGYNSTSPDIVIEVSCKDGGDWQFHTQENGSDVSVEWEVTRQKGKSIVIAATIGRAKGAEDVIIELSRTLVTPTEEGTVPQQWRNLVELKQPAR